MSRPAAVSALAALARLLARRGHPWYVFGAQAVVAYGRPRLTADVDVTIDIGRRTVAAFVRQLEVAGFPLRFQPSAGHLARATLLPIVHARTEIPLDVVIAGRGLEQEFLARARVLDLGGVKVPVISVEDLVAVKVLAARRKDLEDVRGVLEVQGDGIDLARTRDVLAAIENATGERTLLRRLDRVVRSARRQRARR